MTREGDGDVRARRARRRLDLSELLRPVRARSPRTSAGLAQLLRALRQRRRSRVKPAYRSYAEQEVRDRIYGWHSGTVEPPEPRDSFPHPLAPSGPGGGSR